MQAQGQHQPLAQPQREEPFVVKQFNSAFIDQFAR